jgi:hypothetical protein
MLGPPTTSHLVLQSVLLELIMKDMSKTEHMIGFIFYVQSHCQIKVSQNEFNRYENLSNTAYVVSQNMLPFTDYTYKWFSFGQ